MDQNAVARTDDRATAPESDPEPVTRAAIVALLLCAFALLIDGFDVYLVGNLGPAIAAHFGRAPAALSIVFLFQQTGLALGAFLISPLADRFGRKNVMLACALAFGLLTLAALLASTLLAFALLRAFAAVFLSGLVPSAIAILVGITPPRRQGLFVSLAFAGYGAGTIGGALVGALLLRHYGWQSGFWLGGIVPLVYVVVAAWLLPGHIGRRGMRSPELAARSAATPERSALFGPGRTSGTALLWAIFFFSSGTIALMLSWMPTFFVERGGITLQAYSSVASFALAGSLVGTLTIGLILDRLRSIPVLMTIWLLLVAAIELMAHAPFGTAPFIACFAALALFQGAGQTAFSIIVAQSYPNATRARGIGWAFGAGRIGGIAGPALGGLMMAKNVSLGGFLLFLAFPLLVCVGLLGVLDRVRGRQTVAPQ